MKFKNKIVIVTGAGSGIGQAVSLAFAKEGAILILTGRTRAKLEKTYSMLRELEGRAEIKVCDISRKNQIEQVIREVVKNYKKIDILINCAGLNFIKDALETTEPEWKTIVDTNLSGTFFFTQIVSKEMIKQKAGKIINISSIHAFASYPLRLTYATSKAGIAAMTRSFALELGKFGVNINCLAPGQILTEQVLNIAKSGNLDLQKVKLKTPMNRVGTLDDVIGPIFFLASKESDFIQGQTIVVDGGYLLNAAP